MTLARRRFRRTPMETDIDMTPMLDIVFIMLIFFIVTAVFLDEKGVDFTQIPDVDGPPPTARAITVYVYANGTASVEGQLTDMQAVLNNVQGIRGIKPDSAVLLRADSQSALKHVVFLQDEFAVHAIPSSLKVDD